MSDPLQAGILRHEGGEKEDCQLSKPRWFSQWGIVGMEGKN